LQPFHLSRWSVLPYIQGGLKNFGRTFSVLSERGVFMYTVRHFCRILHDIHMY
jgi:hypothetical protein